MHHPDYPPKKRRQTPLGPLDIRITCGDSKETIRLDPNNLAFNAYRGNLPKEGFDGLESHISGQNGALQYEADDIVLYLTPDELLRFCRHSLRPEEYFKLRETFGIFYEIHEDFYHAATGTAEQPMDC